MRRLDRLRRNGNGPGVILDGITVDINIPRAAYSFTAGIVGRGVTQATKCNVYGFLAGGSGLTDYNRVSGTFIFKTAMEDCHNYATINGRVAVGLWGGETGKVVNCSNSGNLTATGENSYGVHNSGYAAGIAYKGQFDNCMNDGTVASTNGSAFGIAYSGTAEHCRNIGSVSGALNTYGTSGVEAHHSAIIWARLRQKTARRTASEAAPTTALPIMRRHLWR